MKSILLSLFIFILSCITANAGNETVRIGGKEPLPVAVMKVNLPLYEAFVAEKGGDPLAITDFSSKNSNRVVVDMVLLQQALKIGGIDNPLHFYAMPNPARAQAEVKSGNAVLLGFETWSIDFDEHVYMSDKVIGRGDFLKVLVGRADNKPLMAVKTLAELRRFSALTGHRWTIDQLTLEEMDITRVTKVAKYKLQLSMLQKGRADFGMYEYPNTGVDLPKGLAVVPGITVGLEGSRHFMVSKRHRMGDFVYHALEKGLAELKAKGTLRKAYIECGFISPLLESWTRLYPVPAANEIPAQSPPAE